MNASEVAVTVVGADRPGIIADVTGALAGVGVNLEDSTMTLLRGHFAMMVVCAGAQDPVLVERALAPLTADDLTIAVRALTEPEPASLNPLGYVLTVHGGDRPGIVAAVTRVLADVQGNITDLSTRLTGALYVLIAEVDLPADTDVAELTQRLSEVGASLGVGVGLRPAEADVL